MKYPWTSDLLVSAGKKKYGCNQSERSILTEIATELGLCRRSDTSWCRHPLAYLMEAADDICYASIDLEDGIEMGFISYHEVIQILGIIIDFDRIPSLHPSCEGNDLLNRQNAIARGRVMNVLVEGVVDTFIQHKDDLLNGNFQDEDLITACGDRVKEFIDAAKNTAKEKIFNNPRKIQIELDSHAAIEILLDAFILATSALKNSNDNLVTTNKSKTILNLMGRHQPKPEWSLHHSYLHVLDFIAGMTDNSAANIANQIGEMNE